MATRQFPNSIGTHPQAPLYPTATTVGEGGEGIKGDPGLLGLPGAAGLDGDAGPQGEAGPTGLRGDPGLLGLPGASGGDGATGAQGIQGDTGLKGDPGLLGLPGADGADGADGVQGETGPQGLTGNPGLLGLPGSTGAQGIHGEVGPTGETGAIGNPGLLGMPGATGATGSQGAQGVQGVQGDGGLDGEDGAQGNPGLLGLPGTVGADGPQGPQGVKGNTGNTGPIGPRGIDGPQGIQGETGDTGATGAKGNPGLLGMPGAVGADGPQGIRGVKGDTGDVGATGPTGPQGIQGVKGNTGNTGPTGATGPRGIQGDEGPQGPQGIEGDQGVQGNSGLLGLPGVSGTPGVGSVGKIPVWGSGNTLGESTMSESSGVVNFLNLPKVGGIQVSLSNHTHAFSSITSKPTTIGGYGITDFNSLGDARWIRSNGQSGLTGNYFFDAATLRIGTMGPSMTGGNVPNLGTGIDSSDGTTALTTRAVLILTGPTQRNTIRFRTSSTNNKVGSGGIAFGDFDNDDFLIHRFPAGPLRIDRYNYVTGTADNLLKLNIDGVAEFTNVPKVSGVQVALSNHTHAFSAITGKPTTIGGYGITDFNSLGDARYMRLFGGGTVSGQWNFTTLPVINGTTVSVSTHTHQFAAILGKLSDSQLSDNVVLTNVEKVRTASERFPAQTPIFFGSPHASLQYTGYHNGILLTSNLLYAGANDPTSKVNFTYMNDAGTSSLAGANLFIKGNAGEAGTYMAFYTAPVSGGAGFGLQSLNLRFRVSGNGEVYVPNGGMLKVDGSLDFNDDSIPDRCLTGNVPLLNAGTNSFTGDMVVAGEITGHSDARLKHSVEPLRDALYWVKKLRGVDFRWNDTNKPSIGVIAQEIEEVYPELVVTNPVTGIKSVAYGKLTAVLIEAVKELAYLVENRG